MSTSRVVAVIQARMGSSRLPGKVLLEVAGDTVLGHVIQRVMHVRGVGQVVVATTTLPEDDRIAAHAQKRGAAVTRGSRDDVRGRYLQAFDEHGGEIGLRVTADCPCLDPALVSHGIDVFNRAKPVADYLSNTLERSYPRGYDFELFRVSALREAAAHGGNGYAREHVTPGLYQHSDRFRIASLRREDPLGSAEWRLTLDTTDDWKLVSAVFDALAPTSPVFGLAEVERFLTNRPDLLELNRHVVQRS